MIGYQYQIEEDTGSSKEYSTEIENNLEGTEVDYYENKGFSNQERFNTNNNLQNHLQPNQEYFIQNNNLHNNLQCKRFNPSSILFNRQEDDIRLSSIYSQPKLTYAVEGMYESYFGNKQMNKDWNCSINNNNTRDCSINNNNTKDCSINNNNTRDCSFNNNNTRDCSFNNNNTEPYDNKTLMFSQNEFYDRINKRVENFTVKDQHSVNNFNLRVEQERVVESLNSCIHTEKDCSKLCEKIKKGEMRLVHRRLNPIEKGTIKAGSIFIYSEKQAKIRRWTDGRTWSPSRVRGCFLTYKENAGVLYKKTHSMNLNGETIHIVAYSTISWEKTRECCRKYSKEDREIKGKTRHKRRCNLNDENGIHRLLNAGY